MSTPIAIPRGRAVFDLRSSADGAVHSLGVTGIPPSGWIGALSHGLAARNFDIRKGRGSRDGRGSWTAEIEFTSHRGAPDVRTLDLATLAAHKPPDGPERPLSLRSVLFTDPSDGESIAVSVVAADSVGFLASLLRQFALFSLFPREFVIATQGNVARDRFTLRGISGRRPSPEACQALRQRLDALVPAPNPRALHSIDAAERILL